MKRTLWIVGGGAVALIAVAAIAVTVLLSNIGSLIKAAVETYGREALQAKVTLAEADVSVKNGQGRLAGLVVGNPQGFATPAALRLGEVKVTLDTARTTKDVIVLKEVLIAAPQVTYEMASGGSNFDALQKNAQSYAQKMGAGGAKKDEKKGEGPKLIIDNLYVRDGKVGVSHALLKGKQLDAPLPNIHLKDIGKEKKGATPEEVGERLMASISQGARNAAGTLNIDKLIGEASGLAKGAAEGAAKAAGEAAQGATKALEGAAGAAGDTMKKLLGK
ncbi:MAG: hypothetical protein FJX37_07665 [Alphaproteobacteria bacterium]|nr:hypothetical protein [Alphaproteobacteria bacterium]MBM3950117.1 hypothetical protein [Rhodospirillales bacterium]